jgi:hypothetical protein
MNWYIGQEIVCIKTHSQGLVKRGGIYTIMGLQPSKCKCEGVDINVGIVGDAKSYSLCSDCHHIWFDFSSVHWFGEQLFAPLEYNQDAINELMEEAAVI